VTDRKTVFRFITKMLLVMDIRKLNNIYSFILGLSDPKDNGEPDEILNSTQISIIEAIWQLKPINVYRVSVVANTLKSMEQEAAQKEESHACSGSH